MFAEEMLVSLCQCTQCGFCYVEPCSQVLIDHFVHKPDTGRPSENDIKRMNKKIKSFSNPLKRYVLKVFKKYPYNDVTPNYFLTLLMFPFSFFMAKRIITYQGNGKLLDVGCNTGLTLEIFKALGWDVSGVEPRECCLQAKERGLNVFHGVLEDAVYPEHSFDVVRFNQVLEHISDPIRALTIARNLLAPDGRMYVECPNQNSLFFRIFKDDFYCYPGHFHIFSPYTINLLCRKLGLRVARSHVRCTPGFLQYGLRKVYARVGTFKKMLIFPFIRLRIVTGLIIKPVCFLIQVAGYGDIFEVEIVADK